MKQPKNGDGGEERRERKKGRVKREEKGRRENRE